MNTRWISNIVKVFILLLIGFSALVMTILLPLLAAEMSITFAEIAYIKTSMMILSETVMLFFVMGLVIILYLLYLFDQGKAFTINFSQKIRWLVALCVVVNIELMVMFVILSAEGGPSPGLFLLLSGAFLCFNVLSAILFFISQLIVEAVRMREEHELTI